MGRLHRARWGRAIHRFVDDELNPARTAKVGRHVTGCPGCTRELQALRRLKASLLRLGDRRPPELAVGRLVAEAARIGAT